MDRTTRVRTATAVAATVLSCLTAPAADSPATTFIGVLPAEPPARIAVVVEGNTFLAYACGRTDEFNRAASAWFKGTVTAGRLEATAGDLRLSATLENRAVRGALTTAGDREREFTARPVSPTAVAGLYRAVKEVDGDALVYGWIVDAKHQVVGGCRGKKKPAVALQANKPLPPAPPANEDPPADEKRQAEDLIVQQVDEEPEVAVQGEKVTSAVTPPAGKVLKNRKK